MTIIVKLYLEIIEYAYTINCSLGNVQACTHGYVHDEIDKWIIICKKLYEYVHTNLYFMVLVS